MVVEKCGIAQRLKLCQRLLNVKLSPQCAQGPRQGFHAFSLVHYNYSKASAKGAQVESAQAPNSNQAPGLNGSML